MAAKAGEWSETKDTNDTQWICDEVKSQVETVTKKEYAVFEAVKYRDHKIGNDTEFLIKVRVGKGERDYIHIKVKQTPRDLQLSGVRENKTKDDPLEPFDN